MKYISRPHLMTASGLIILAILYFFTAPHIRVWKLYIALPFSCIFSVAMVGAVSAPMRKNLRSYLQAITRLDQRLRKYNLYVAATSLGIACLCFILQLVAAGFYARFVTDDIGFASDVCVYGFFGAYKGIFLSLTGRYTWLALILFLTRNIHTNIAWFIPTLFLIWIFGLVLLFKQKLGTYLAFVLSLATITSILMLDQAIGENVFWISAATNYALPIALLPYIFFLADRFKNPTSIQRAVLAVIAFVYTGFNELGDLLLIAGLALLAVYDYKAYGRTIKPLAAGMIIGLLLFLSAPGSYVRHAQLEGRITMTLVIIYTTSDLSFHVGSILRCFQVLIFTALVFLLIPRKAIGKEYTRLSSGMVIAVPVFYVICYFLTIYALGQSMPSRATIFPDTLLVVGILILGGNLARLKRDVPIPFAAVCLLSAVFLIWQSSLFTYGNEIYHKEKTMSIRYDGLNHQLEASRGQDVVAAPVTIWWSGLDMFDVDKNYQWNKQISLVYHLKSLRSNRNPGQ